MSEIIEEFGSIRKGMLQLAVLKIISAHKVYAADILSRLSNTEFTTQEGTLYPLLSRLRREGLVEYEWIESEAGPPRKYYALTASGKQQLENLEKYWQKIQTTIEELGVINA